MFNEALKAVLSYQSGQACFKALHIAHVLVNFHPGPGVVGPAEKAPRYPRFIGQVSLGVIEAAGQVSLAAHPDRVIDIVMVELHWISPGRRAGAES